MLVKNRLYLQVLVEVPYLLAQAVLFSVISYWMVHFEADPGQSSTHMTCKGKLHAHCLILFHASCVGVL